MSDLDPVDDPRAIQMIDADDADGRCLGGRAES